VCTESVLLRQSFTAFDPERPVGAARGPRPAMARTEGLGGYARGLFRRRELSPVEPSAVVRG